VSKKKTQPSADVSFNEFVKRTYGEGLVVRREGEGEDAKITVSFPRHGMKKLIEKYAKLKRS
jgi:hypothetical protein